VQTFAIPISPRRRAERISDVTTVESARDARTSRRHDDPRVRPSRTGPAVVTSRIVPARRRGGLPARRTHEDRELGADRGTLPRRVPRAGVASRARGDADRDVRGGLLCADPGGARHADRDAAPARHDRGDPALRLSARVAGTSGVGLHSALPADAGGGIDLTRPRDHEGFDRPGAVRRRPGLHTVMAMTEPFEYISHARLEYRSGYRP